ncbi:hypothetical protein [Stenotrophomonas sp. MMGLT7]|uniref:hypothetical protein n=1 Tax=Stenotrophomonas sp. MMGLT7 TaxID=2901227 RepID=UPI001E4C1C15|nr:hypothetical protein [Stenotrophomonas sp. MMGLT7]MCD7100414.1 hypothetical protein [Stenotrophomonas sp. MMGLT7]
MDNDRTLAESTTSQPRDTRVQARVAPEPLIFLRPQTNELYVCRIENTPTVLREIASIDEWMAQLFAAQAVTRETELKPDVSEQELDAALRKEEEARDKLFDELKEVKGFSGGDEMMELVMLPSSSQGNRYRGKTLTYVRSSKVKNHFRSHKLAQAEQPEMKSFLMRDGASGKWKLDREKLWKSLRITAEETKLDEEIGELVLSKWADEAVPDFVEQFNKDFNFEREAATSEEEEGERMVDFSGGATFLRAFATGETKVGASVSGSLADALKGKGSIDASYKAKGNASLVLAEGKIGLDLYLPDKSGMELALPVAGGEDASLGFLQIKLGVELSGFVGASILAEGGVELKAGVNANGEQVQGIRGVRARRRTGARMRDRKFSVALEPEGSAGADLSAFAGAEGVLGIKGAANWLKPTTKDEFATFADIAPSISGQAGAGATAAFKIEYKERVLRVHCKLGACWGLGLKGSVDASVSPLTLLEFQAWFYYQVMNAGSRNLQYFAKEAWDVYLRMQALAALAGKTIVEYYGQTKDQLDAFLREWLVRRPRELIAAIASGVAQAREMLPEVRAFLLALIQDAYRRLQQMGEDAYDALKDMFTATDVLTEDIYLEREYRNVLQHASLQIGESGDAQGMESFLAAVLGPGRVDELQRLKREPTPGYYVVPNRAFAYRLQSGTHVAWEQPWWDGSNGTMVA